MSSPFKKIQENSKKFEENEFYKKMTPEGYKIALETMKKELAAEYNVSLMKLAKEYDKQLEIIQKTAIDTISVELLYELANQMNAFYEKDEYVKNQIIDRVQEIHEKTMNAIKRYADIKNPSGEFLKRKNKIEKLFRIEF